MKVFFIFCLLTIAFSINIYEVIECLAPYHVMHHFDKILEIYHRESYKTLIRYINANFTYLREPLKNCLGNKKNMTK